MDKHLSSQFDAELSGISTRVLEMGGMVESQVAQAMLALTQFDGEIADQVIRTDADLGLDDHGNSVATATALTACLLSC